MFTNSKTVTSYYLCPEHMRKHLTPVSTIKQEGYTESCKEVTMNDTLTDLVDQLNVLEDFNASSMSEALKWTDLVQEALYQIVSTCTVYTAWAICHYVSPESRWILLQFLGMWYDNERVAAKPYGDGELTVICTAKGLKTSKIGRMYNSYQLLPC